MRLLAELVKPVALVGAPAELYMFFRMGHFVSAWTQFLAQSDKDNWAAQANTVAQRRGGTARSAWTVMKRLRARTAAAIRLPADSGDGRAGCGVRRSPGCR